MVFEFRSALGSKRSLEVLDCLQTHAVPLHSHETVSRFLSDTSFLSFAANVPVGQAMPIKSYSESRIRLSATSSRLRCPIKLQSFPPTPRRNRTQLGSKCRAAKTVGQFPPLTRKSCIYSAESCPLQGCCHSPTMFHCFLLCTGNSIRWRRDERLCHQEGTSARGTSRGVIKLASPRRPGQRFVPPDVPGLPSAEQPPPSQRPRWWRRQ